VAGRAKCLAGAELALARRTRRQTGVGTIRTIFTRSMLPVHGCTRIVPRQIASRMISCTSGRWECASREPRSVGSKRPGRVRRLRRVGVGRSTLQSCTAGHHGPSSNRITCSSASMLSPENTDLARPQHATTTIRHPGNLGRQEPAGRVRAIVQSALHSNVRTDREGRSCPSLLGGSTLARESAHGIHIGLVPNRLPPGGGGQ
jgi:hypothetical protein